MKEARIRAQNRLDSQSFHVFPPFFLIYTQQLDITRARVEFSTDGNTYIRDDSFRFSGCLSIPSLGHDRSATRSIEFYLPSNPVRRRTLRIQPRRWTEGVSVPLDNVAIYDVFLSEALPLPLLTPAIIRCPRPTSFFPIVDNVVRGDQNQNRSNVLNRLKL